MIIDENAGQILIRNEAIPFRVKRGRKPNRVSLALKAPGILHINTGSGTLTSFDRDFIHKHSSWILKNFGSRKVLSGKREEFLTKIDHEIILLGKPTPLKWVKAGKTGFHFKASEGLTMNAPENLIQNHKKEVLFYGLRALAAKKLPAMLDIWAQKCELKVNRVVIKDLSSRWGSCSHKKNINLNWQLIFLTEEQIEYVIIHELMHMHEMNHSKKFWDWVGKYCPDYKKLRKQIKEQEWLIGILK